MCIAIYKPLGKKLPKQTYFNCFTNNDDGAGFAYIKDGKLFVAKGFFTFEEFWENYEPLEEKASLIHFRVGTSGGNNGENCHPWRVTKDLVFIHNGVISSIDRENQAWSDTGNYCENVLKPLTECFPEWWKQPEFKWMMENAIGSGNKVVLLGVDGSKLILNEKAGEWKDDVWFSNTSYMYPRYSNAHTYHKTHRVAGGGQAWGSDDDDTDVTPNRVAAHNVKGSEAETEIADVDVRIIDQKLEEAEARRQARKGKESKETSKVK